MNNIRALQEVCLEILKEIDRVCKKNNILYWLDGGSMLGAVRHHGFIPWDDDLDIQMFREDYNRFLEIAPGELKKGYFLQTHETDPEYLYFFAKVRKNNTFIDEETFRKANIHKGIYVDIFPVDKKIKKGIFLWMHRIRLSVLMHLYFLAGKNTIRPLYPRLNKKWINFILKKVYINKGKTRKKIGNLLERFNNKPFTENNASWTLVQKNNWLYKKKWHESFIEVSFEDMMVKIPAMYDEILTNQYGDYMTPPSKEKQVPGHGLSFLIDIRGDQNEQ